MADYWPEFGANGKEGLTLSDILRHEGGLTKFDTTLTAEDLATVKIKENKVGQIIEKQKLMYVQRNVFFVPGGFSARDYGMAAVCSQSVVCSSCLHHEISTELSLRLI